MDIEEVKKNVGDVKDPDVEALINDLEIIRVEWQKELDAITVKRQEYEKLIEELRSFRDTLEEVKAELLSAVE